jgi:flavorubredoxin
MFSLDKPYKATKEIDVLPSHYPIPGEGFLPINAFVIKSAEPVLVDTGIGIDSEKFMDALESVIDPEDLKWIWLTHDDLDHTGSVRKVLETATNARLIANALTVLRMSTSWQMPMNRVYFLNPGESISVGDRKLTAVRPILFDNPGTIGIYDNKSEVFFSADSFGAILPTFGMQSADKIMDVELVKGMITWAKADDPWIHFLDKEKFRQKLDKIRQMSPKMILSSHLPPAKEKTEKFLKILAEIPESEPWLAPNQAALEKMLAQKREGE